MIGFIKAVFIFALVLLAIGTVCALISSWRQGVLKRDWEWVRTGLEAVYLKIKNFAQRIFNRQLYRHACAYWVYYGLVGLFLLLIISQIA